MLCSYQVLDNIEVDENLYCKETKIRKNLTLVNFIGEKQYVGTAAGHIARDCVQSVGASVVFWTVVC